MSRSSTTNDPVDDRDPVEKLCEKREWFEELEGRDLADTSAEEVARHV